MSTVHIYTPDELKAIRAELGRITQADAAQRIGVARRTWMYWEAPHRERRPSRSHCLLIRAMVEDFRRSRG